MQVNSHVCQQVVGRRFSEMTQTKMSGRDNCSDYTYSSFESDCNCLLPAYFWIAGLQITNYCSMASSHCVTSLLEPQISWSSAGKFPSTPFWCDLALIQKSWHSVINQNRWVCMREEILGVSWLSKIDFNFIFYQNWICKAPQIIDFMPEFNKKYHAWVTQQ